MRLRDRAELGLGTVEVLIAVLMLMVVASTVSLATTTSGQMRGSVRLQSSMTTASQRVLEDVVTDRRWMRTCTTIDRTCNIPRNVVRDESLDLRDVDGDARIHRLVTVPIDSETDGQDDEDEDGLIPDYYRVEFEIRPSADVARRFRTTQARAARKVVTTVDRRGDQALGSLAVEVCQVLNQSDERMSVQGCANDTNSSIRMAGCAPTQTTCNAQFSSISGRFGAGATAPAPTAPSPFVTMQRVAPRSLGIRLRHEASAWSASTADAEIDSAGRLIFHNVPAGNVRVERIPASIGARTERWTTKEMPSYLGDSSTLGTPVVVEPGVRARALVVYRPTMTNRGINLEFERRTHTHHVTGPHHGHQIVVEQWRRTDSYEGIWAQRICDIYDDNNQYGSAITMERRCDGIEPGPGRNCATVYRSGQYALEDSVNGWFFIDEGFYREIDFQMYQDYDLELPEVRYVRRWAFHVPIATLCTVYWEEYDTTYYKRSRTSNRIRDGIAQPLTYSMQPGPTNRYVEKRSNGALHEVVSQCVAAIRSQCASGSDAPHSLQRLVPGINTPLRSGYGASGREPGQMSASAANEVNTRLGVTPSAAWNVLRSSNALWVRPNGDIVNANGGGTVPAGTTIRARGEGECYWNGAPNLSGETMGSCDPCTVMWEPGWEFPNACSVLTKIVWHRHVREYRTYYDFPDGTPDAGDRFNDLESKHGTIRVLQACRDAVPQVIGRCETVTRRPEPTPIPRTTHQGEAGTGVVNARPVNVAPGET